MMFQRKTRYQNDVLYILKMIGMNIQSGSQERMRDTTNRKYSCVKTATPKRKGKAVLYERVTNSTNTR